MAPAARLAITSGLVHPSPIARRRLVRLVAGAHADAILGAARPTGARTVSRTWPPVQSAGPSLGFRLVRNDPPELVVLYLHHQRDDPAAVGALSDYVAAGGRLLGVHSATASFKGNRRFGDLFGGTFSGHARVGPTELVVETRHAEPCVVPSPRSTEPCGSLPERVSLVDEAYDHDLSREIDVWYRWQHGAPAVWTRRYGAGLVGYVAMGHRAGVWTIDGVGRIVCRVVSWLEAGGADDITGGEP